MGAMPRKDLTAVLERLWPDGLVEMNVDYEDSWFFEIQSKLTRALQGLKGCSLPFEREAEGEPVWWDGSDPDGDPPDDFIPNRSYHLYFVAPDGPGFEFTTEAEEVTDDGTEIVPGAGRTGWCVAVSLLAPFAVVTLSEWIESEDGATTDPTIESYLEDSDGTRLDPEQNFREMVDEPVFSQLIAVRAKIEKILEKNGVEVLPETEWSKPLPGFRLDGGIAAPDPPRVLDTLFFEEV
jgi:hypothetical protein